jgi:branched-subunit amino acid transport protein
VSEAWLVVLLCGVGTVMLKGLGPAVVGGRALPPRATRMVALLAPTMLAALVVTQTFADGEELVLDARAAGIGAALLALAARAPFLVVIAAAAGGAALTRAVT